MVAITDLAVYLDVQMGLLCVGVWVGVELTPEGREMGVKLTPEREL